ncbi:MAG: O-antigen ligase family protein [Candidatus Roizmanbacteria bacterium]|nr:O-antigen ligase family protein [Candidatus Roizmanbacteria bacterium]
MNVYAHIIGSMFFIIPLIFSIQSNELFEFPKMLSIYLYALGLIPITAYRIYYYSKQRLPLPMRLKILLGSLGLFILSQIASTYFSIDKHVSLYGYYSRFNGGLMSLLAYNALGISTYVLLLRKDIHTVFRWGIFGGIVTALWALPSHFGYDIICFITSKQFNAACWTNSFDPTQRIFGTLGQPNWFAAYLLIQLSLVLYFVVTEQKLATKFSALINTIFLTTCAILYSLEMVWTRSRSAYIAFGIIAALWLAYSIKLRKKVALVVFIIASMALFSIGPMIRNEFEFVPTTEQQASQEKITTANNEVITPSSVIRLIVWRGALDVAQRYPLLGSGVETFAYSYYFTRPLAHNATSEWNYVYNKAHNEVLNYAATSGFVGVSTYLLFFGAVVWLALYTLRHDSRYKHTGILALSILSAIFVTNFFGFSTTTINLYFYLIPFLILLITKPQFKTVPRPPKWLYIFFLMLLTYAVASVADYYNADKYYALSKKYSQQDDISNAYTMIQKAIDTRYEPSYADEQAYLSAQIALYSSTSGDKKNAQNFAKQAQNARKEILSVSPFNVNYWRTAGKTDYLLSLVFADDDKKSKSFFQTALKDFEQAQKIAPTDPRNFYAEALIQSESDKEKAVQLLNKTLQLKRDYPDAKKYLQQLQKSVK